MANLRKLSFSYYQILSLSVILQVSQSYFSYNRKYTPRQKFSIFQVHSAYITNLANNCKILNTNIVYGFGKTATSACACRHCCPNLSDLRILADVIVLQFFMLNSTF